MKDKITRILESYIVDKSGETRPFINPGSIESIADEIEEAIIDFNDFEPHGSTSGETGVCYNHPNQGDISVKLLHVPSGKTGYVIIGTVQV